VTRASAAAVGVAVWLAVGAFGLAVLGATWPAYAMAVPTKAYSSAMLLARLAVALAASLSAGAVAGRVGGTRAAWWTAAVVAAASLVVHVGIVWRAYPAWYHAAYLLPLVPLIRGAGSLSSSGGRR
jgi:hypothetical protein